MKYDFDPEEAERLNRLWLLAYHELKPEESQPKSEHQPAPEKNSELPNS